MCTTICYTLQCHYKYYSITEVSFEEECDDDAPTNKVLSMILDSEISEMCSNIMPQVGTFKCHNQILPIAVHYLYYELKK